MNASAIVSNLTKSPLGSKLERMQGILSTYNEVPIDFYGRLEDQFGNPVAGAEIKGSIRVINGVRQGTDWFSTTSDADGLFQFHGRGQDIGMMPRKEGYALATTDTFFKYSHMEEHPFVSDVSNPTVIKMWKVQGGQPLIHFHTQVNVPIDGTQRLFDLKTGAQVGSGGDIILSVRSSPKPNIREQYDWELTIRVVGGGLLVSGSGFDQMFQAPESAYEPTFIANYQKGVKPWSTTFNGVFYFMSRGGGAHGKIAIEVLSDVVKDGTVPVILNSYLNATGSRNLEIDPSLVAEVHP